MKIRSRISALTVTTCLAALTAAGVSSCQKESVQIATTRDSSSTSTQTVQQPSAQTTAKDTGLTSITGAPLAANTAHPERPGGQQNATPQTSTTPGQTDTSVHYLDPNDPVAKQMLEAMKHQQELNSRKIAPPPAGVGYKLIPATELTTLVPRIPGYRLYRDATPFTAQGSSRATALLLNAADTTHSIRVIVLDQDERGPSRFSQQLAALRQAGSLTDYTQGEPVTAYYVQVNGMPAAKAYIPSKKVATLTVFVNDHRLIQLREDKVNSADHLVEVSKYLDTKKFEAMK